jgi:hypothetical protein
MYRISATASLDYPGDNSPRLLIWLTTQAVPSSSGAGSE